jgi:hypothetical protein
MDDSNPLRALRKGELPRMVAWYDPRLLARVGIRTMVSSVFGQYADQRLIQAATDNIDNGSLADRYDYRDPTPEDPMRRIALDGTGAYWIDYIADTGDGFETTYGMAYLLAQDKLGVRGAADPLTHGDILVMGGDQCYPQATREEYKRRLLTPFEWAYDVPEPQRKLFAIPGNHDWYDGLAAFDSLFCSSRDRLSKAKGNAIGGWQCQQHRSYWALRLPYNWWIWGCDIQFSQYLDLAQVNYFAEIAEQMGPDDKVILCIAEPSWLLADQTGEDEEQNFFKITAIARSRGARVCAVIAGDWHHYNRYYQPELDVHFFTAGGGGSFLHPTHVLRNQISVQWPEAQAADDMSDTTRPITPGGGRWRAQDYDIRLSKEKAKGLAKDVVADVGKAVQDVGEAVQETVIDPIMRETGGSKPKRSRRPIKPQEPKCYPEKWTSILLSFRNLWFPFYNKWFAAGIGLVYWLMTWQFATLVTQHDISSGKIDSVGVTTSYWSVIRYMPLYLAQAALVSISFVACLVALYAVLVWYVPAPEKPRWKRLLAKFGVGTAHFLTHVTTMFALGLLFIMLNNWMSPPIEQWVNETWRSQQSQPGIVREVLNETLEPLTTARQTQRETYQRDPQQQRAAGAVKTAPPPGAAPSAAPQNTQSAQFRQLLGFVFYPLEMIVIGGLIGGFLWGLYWVVTGIFGRMHAEDAFAALRIKDYKNFLRFKFEREQLTIYPIGIDRMPRHEDWANKPKETPATGSNSRLRPVRPLDVRLIEAPIIIKADPGA